MYAAPRQHSDTSNISGIKLRGASFLMHKVYDDEMTFKLVAAASTVSGLPMEVCLEEFGKHFLVYCQKNGYDQILRVLGGNLYDFLTNLDNLHDHLASIYPGMRAPSFRVTHNLDRGDQEQAQQDNLISASGKCPIQQQQQQHTYENPSNVAREIDPNGNGNGDINASMYLHYYSERAGLSPIVKGLVMAVAREFFDTDIVVTECESVVVNANQPEEQQQTNRKSSSISGDEEQQSSSTSSTIGSGSGGGGGEHGDDHVVFKIDRRPVELRPVSSEKINQEPPVDSASYHTETIAIERQPEVGEIESDFSTATQDSSKNYKDSRQQVVQPTAKMLELSGSLSASAKDSLVNGEIMMQTFPFHVIFDRHFNIVQVGRSLLKVTSLYWKSRAQSDENSPVKFSDLFQIVRPKIDFTFDAIADHTNQVFVVKSKPLVLNADQRRQSMSSLVASFKGTGGGSGELQSVTTGNNKPDDRRTGKRMSMCPMDRIAREHRRMSSAVARANLSTNENLVEAKARDQDDATTTGGGGKSEVANDSETINEQEEEMEEMQQQMSQHSLAHSNHDDPMDAQNPYLSLRLKGQMIILANQRPGEPPLCLYLCSPRVDHIDQLMDVGVNMSDFALYDRARELMLMSHTHKEDRENVKKLDQATNDLKKMDTKLRAENKRTNEVLHNIFPAKIATLLSHGHKIDSESFDPVTCLYSDIIGFTKMCGSENVRPIDIVRLLNTLYLQFDSLTNIHGVFKVETIGDAYVVVGGLPEPAEDHADRCVKMGLDMVKVIATVRSPADNQPIQMRIGIHSGPVMAGIVGIRVPRYSLFGNTTTLANQLETNGVGGKIHISGFTLKQLIKRENFVLEDNPNEIPGFPFKTYFVTNYIGDEVETLKYKKILEEQLVKDLELMGQEVEFVDDSTGTGCNVDDPFAGHHHQLAAIPSGQQPGGWPKLSAESSSISSSQLQVLETTSGNFKREQLPEKATSAAETAEHQNRKLGPRKLLSETLVNNSSCGDSFNDDFATINNNNANLQQDSDDPGGKPTGSVDRRRRRRSKTSNATHGNNGRRTNLLLMDLEGEQGTFSGRVEGNYCGSSSKMTLQSSERSDQIQRLASHISDSILADAMRIIPPVMAMSSKKSKDTIKRGEEDDNERTARLLAVLADRQADLELVLRKQTSGKPCQSQPNSCPLCDGFGSLDNVKSLLRFRIPIDLLSTNTCTKCKNDPTNENRESRNLILDFDRDQFGVGTTNCKPERDTCGCTIDKLSCEQKLRVGQFLSRVGSELTGGEQTSDVKKNPTEAEVSQLLGSHGRRQSIELLIGELRSERLKLDEKIKEMKHQQQQYTAFSIGKSSQLATMQQQQPPVPRPKQPPPEVPQKLAGGQSRSIITAARGQLSSNIQRMKRMDTLKRRKMKREQQQESTGDKTSMDLSDTVQNLSNIKFARVRLMSQNTSNELEDNEEEEDDDLEQRHDMTGVSLPRTPSKSNSNHKSTIISEEAIAEELSDDEAAGQAANQQQQSTAASFKSELGGFLRRKFSRAGQESFAREQKLLFASSTSPSGDQRVSSGKASGQASDCRTPTKRPGNANNKINESGNATGASYSYQAFRASLASLMSEAVINVRPKLNLANAFASLSANSSPMKRPTTPNATNTTNKNQKLSHSRTQSQESRKQSSRSQSSSSGCGGLVSSSVSPKTGGGTASRNPNTSGYHINNNNKHADSGGGRSSNCSCLKSSASSQSFESING